MAVNLFRDAQANLPGIENNPNSFYRAHGAAGFKDWLGTNEVRGNPVGAYNDTAYFSKGAPLDRYTASNRSGRTHIIESNSPNIQQQNSYFGAPKLTNKDFYKVHALQPDGTYQNVHTNVPTEMIRSGGMIPTALSKVAPYVPQAIKNGASMIGNFMGKLNLPMLGAQAVYNATEDQRARNETQQRIRDFASIPMNTEIRGGR